MRTSCLRRAASHNYYPLDSFGGGLRYGQYVPLHLCHLFWEGLAFLPLKLFPRLKSWLEKQLRLDQTFSGMEYSFQLEELPFKGLFQICCDRSFNSLRNRLPLACSNCTQQRQREDLGYLKLSAYSVSSLKIQIPASQPKSNLIHLMSCVFFFFQTLFLIYFSITSHSTIF